MIVHKSTVNSTGFDSYVGLKIGIIIDLDGLLVKPKVTRNDIGFLELRTNAIGMNKATFLT